MQVPQHHCNRQQYKGLFVVDLDGTLLTSQRQIARPDLQALGRLRQMGYLTAIATGRSNYSFLQLLAKLGFHGSESLLPVDYVIFSTGAGIMDFPGKRLLQSSSLSAAAVRSAVDYLQTSGLDYMIHRPVPDSRYFLYSSSGGVNADFHRRLTMYQEFAAPLCPEALDALGEATQVLCIVPDDKGHAVAKEAAEILNQCSVIKATSPLDGTSIWIEIFAPDVSKSRAVKWLADTVGLERHNTCAVGNDYNDLDLLHWAGQGFLVDNAPSSLHNLFPVVASNDNCGVAEAVARWLR